MSILAIYLDAETEARLKAIAEETGRKVEELAECAVSESALDYFRNNPKTDPARAKS